MLFQQKYDKKFCNKIYILYLTKDIKNYIINELYHVYSVLRYGGIIPYGFVPSGSCQGTADPLLLKAAKGGNIDGRS